MKPRKVAFRKWPRNVLPSQATWPHGSHASLKKYVRSPWPKSTVHSSTADRYRSRSMNELQFLRLKTLIVLRGQVKLPSLAKSKCHPLSYVAGKENVMCEVASRTTCADCRQL
eukprot:6197641-Pleurochrysis_carterae.AAC.3